CRSSRRASSTALSGSAAAESAGSSSSAVKPVSSVSSSSCSRTELSPTKPARARTVRESWSRLTSPSEDFEVGTQLEGSHLSAILRPLRALGEEHIVEPLLAERLRDQF